MAAAEPELTYRAALEVIDRAAHYEQPLRRRTEGVTWMLWGLVTVGLLGSSAAMERLVGYPSPWVDFLFLPWLLVGVAGTKAVWGIAGVALPATREGTRRSAGAILAAMAALTAFWLAAAAVVAPQNLAPFMLFGLGTPWMLLGALNPQRSTREGRVVMVASGVALFLAGFAIAPFVAGLPHKGWHEATLLALAVGGGAPFVGGFLQALRG